MSTMGVVYSIRFKKTNSVVNIILNENIMGMYIKAEINMNYETIKEITKPDVSNSKDANKLTEKEIIEIEKNLSKNKAREKLFEKLSNTDEKEA